MAITGKPRAICRSSGAAMRGTVICTISKSDFEIVQVSHSKVDVRGRVVLPAFHPVEGMCRKKRAEVEPAVRRAAAAIGVNVIRVAQRVLRADRVGIMFGFAALTQCPPLPIRLIFLPR